jgi:hypothetical protein
MECASFIFDGASIAFPDTQECTGAVPEHQKGDGWTAAPTNDPDEPCTYKAEIGSNTRIAQQQDRARLN